MSCAYRHAAVRIATMAGIPRDVMLTAMDIARQQRVTFPDLPPDRLHTIAPLLGITPTCGNPQQVIARIQTALLALGTLHATHPWVERWMAIATALGVPDDHLPVPVHPEIMATVRAQWAAPPPDPAPDRATAGIAALWRGDPIPAELIEEALRMGDRQAIVTWMAHGVWDDRFTDMCRNLTDAEIGIIVRAGVVPDALVAQIATDWWSNTLPWDVFPVTMWDRVADPDIARAGRARTAAAKLTRDPTLRDDQIIAAAARDEYWAADVLITRTDLSDDGLIAAAAENPSSARDVLIARTDLSDKRLIAAAARDEYWAADVLIARTDLSDDCLIAAAAKNATYARDVLIKRPDLSDKRLITAVTKGKPSNARDVLIKRTDLSDYCLIAAVTKGKPSNARDVLIKRPDLRTDVRLLTAIARDRALVDDVLAQVPDLRTHPILTAVRNVEGSSA